MECSTIVKKQVSLEPVIMVVMWMIAKCYASADVVVFCADTAL